MDRRPDSPDLMLRHAVLKQWGEHLADEGRRPELVDRYVTVVRRWWEFTEDPFGEVPAATVTQYFESHAGQHPETRRGAYRYVAVFYRWALEHALTGTDPVAEFGRERGWKTLRATGPTPRDDDLHRFTLAMQRRGLRPATVLRRSAIARSWTIYCGGDPFGDHVTWRDVERYVDELHLTVVNSQYCVISHLHRFYVWAQRDGLTATDPTVLVERPRCIEHLPRPISDTDLMLAITCASPTMRAALLLAATGGLRCIELTRLGWDDVRHTNVFVRGKGNKQRVVPLHPAARDALDELDRVDEWVLPWRAYESTSSEGARASQAINDYLHSLGIHSTAHSLRHWFGTAALATPDSDLRKVQELMGHSSPATTAIYTKVDVTRLAHVVDAIQVPGMPVVTVWEERPAVV